MTPFIERFPELGTRETRTVTVYEAPERATILGVPEGIRVTAESPCVQ